MVYENYLAKYKVYEMGRFGFIFSEKGIVTFV